MDSSASAPAPPEAAGFARGTIVVVHGLSELDDEQLGTFLGLKSGLYVIAVGASELELSPANVRLASHLLNLDDELLGIIFTRLRAFRERLAFRASSRELRRVASDPAHWRRLLLRKEHGESPNCVPLATGRVCALSEGVFPRADVEALCLRTELHLEHVAHLEPSPGPGPFLRPSPSLDAALRFPRLVELDLADSAVSLGMLRAAFECCGATLRRLDISGLRCPYYHPPAATEPGAAEPMAAEPVDGLYPESSDDEIERCSVHDVWDGGRWCDLEASGARIAPSYDELGRRKVVPGWRQKSVGWFDELVTAFEPLAGLRVLRARGVCRMSDSRLLLAASAHCPQLEELSLGWTSEYHAHRLAAPDSETVFNRSPCLARARFTDGLTRLRRLCLAGFVHATDADIGRACELARGLESLDVCGSHQLSDDGLAAALGPVARSLESLNVRGTGFGDRAAFAIAAGGEGGAGLSELNASCTNLSGRGCVRRLEPCATCAARPRGRPLRRAALNRALATRRVGSLGALSDASSRLRMLDLCYARAVTVVEQPGDLLRAFTRHGARLTMLGLGGFTRMNIVMCLRILRMCPRLECLGVGGCAGLGHVSDGEAHDAADALLDMLPELCPSLTSLNAHKLPGVVAQHVRETRSPSPPARRFDAPLTSPPPLAGHRAAAAAAPRARVLGHPRHQLRSRHPRVAVRHQHPRSGSEVGQPRAEQEGGFLRQWRAAF